MAREKKDPTDLSVEQKLKALYQLQLMLSEIDKIKTNVEMEKFQAELEQKVEEQTVELRLQQEKTKNQANCLPYEKDR